MKSTEVTLVAFSCLVSLIILSQSLEKLPSLTLLSDKMYLHTNSDCVQEIMADVVVIITEDAVILGAALDFTYVAGQNNMIVH